MNRSNRAYLIGNGIGPLAAAACMIRDGGIAGSALTLFAAPCTDAGCDDDNPDPAPLAYKRGLDSDDTDTDAGAPAWDPAAPEAPTAAPHRFVADDSSPPACRGDARPTARLMDGHRAGADVWSMGFTPADQRSIRNLAATDEADLDASRIADWLPPEFFAGAFWHMWATTHAFQPWHSAIEFKRHLHRFMAAFDRRDNGAGRGRAPGEDPAARRRRLVRWLADTGMNVVTDCTVTEFDLAIDAGRLAVTGLHCARGGRRELVGVADGDLVFLQNGSTSDAATWGSMTAPAARATKADSGGWALWERLAAGRPDFGNPAAFNSSIAESCRSSFTVRLDHPAFAGGLARLAGRRAGVTAGGLVTFRDSNWALSVVLPDPSAADAWPRGEVCHGAALEPGRIGNFVARPMADCSGAEILQELCGHLNLDADAVAGATCVPCRMPYRTSIYMPRGRGDRPLPVPRTSRNLGFVSQFVEITGDVTSGADYAANAARIAVHELLAIGHDEPRRPPRDLRINTPLGAAVKVYH